MTSITVFIRDAMFDRVVKAVPFKSTRKIPVFPTQMDQLPGLGVYVLPTNANADGDANVSVPRYIVDAGFGISVIDGASKTDVLEGSVDDKLGKILDCLLTDGTFVDLRDADNRPLIDSFPRITWSYLYPKEGETQYVELRLQLTVRYFCNFQPKTPHAFLEVDVATPGNESLAKFNLDQ